MNTVPNTSLFECWQDRFHNMPPLAWVLRECMSSHWFRLYSLPDGKRVPDADSEREEIWRRVQLAIEKTMTFEKNVAIFVPREVYDDEESRYKKEVIFDFGFHKNNFVNIIDNGDFFDVYAMYADLKKFKLKEFVKFVSEDKLMNSIFWDLNGCIFSIYDGGMDIFVFDKNRINSLKLEFSDWISPLKSGL